MSSPLGEVILTGASRGIGRALALRLAAPGTRLVLLARDAGALESLAQEVRGKGGEAVVVAGDLGSVAGARALGLELARTVRPGATLIHNAGLWTSWCSTRAWSAPTWAPARISSARCSRR